MMVQIQINIKHNSVMEKISFPRKSYYQLFYIFEVTMNGGHVTGCVQLTIL